MMLSGATGSGPPPPAQFLDDQFTDTAGTNLTAHTPNQGGAWHYDSVGGSGVVQVNPSADATCTTADNSNETWYHNDATPPSADQVITADFKQYAGQVFNSAAVCGRYSSASNGNCYRLRYLPNSAGWQVQKVISGTATNLGSATSNIGNGNTVSVTLTISGTSITATGPFGTLGPFTDSAISAAGFIALHYNDNGTATAGCHIKNLKASA